MNDFLQLVNARQSDRAYDKSRLVEADKLERLGGKLKGKHFPLIDIGIVAAHIVLAAESEGLGSCILGWFDEKEIKSLTGIPSSKRVLLDILIGYPVKEKRKKIRKESGKIISYNSY